MTRIALALALAGAIAPACSDEVDDLFSDDVPKGDTFLPAPGGLRRLLGRQYVSSVRVLLGDAAAEAATTPDDASLHGFDSIGAAELSLSPSAVATYEASSRAVAQAAVSDPVALARILPCAPTGPADAACHRAFVTTFGRVAWRRALDLPEIDRITGIAQAASSAYGDFNAGLVYAISALLQSPNFLYMVEIGEPSPDNPAVRRLTKGERLTRLSFFLLGQTPDAGLLDFADANELTPDDVRVLARDILLRPEARDALAAFYGEILRIRDLEEVPKDPALFPQYGPEVAQAMKEETLRLIEDVVWTRDADVRELLTADYTFINGELAALYGVPSPVEGVFARVTLPPDQMRSGILSTSAYLARFAHPDTTSPTRRGLFVRTALLCEDIPPPPPGVDTTLPVPSTPTTLKARLQQHMEDPSCSGCHGLIDPIGFALENYDAVGAFRTEDNGFPVDPTADDVPGLGSFASARDLGALLHDDPRVSQCVVKNLLRSSLGHLETPEERAIIDALDASFIEGGYQLQDLLVELCASPAFELVGEPK